LRREEVVMLSSSSAFGLALLLALACNSSRDELSSETRTTSGASPTDFSGPTAVAPSHADPIAAAENARAVVQYPDEAQLGSTPARLVATTPMTVRTVPLGGERVRVAEKGLAVLKVAAHKDYVLVLFPDPTDSAKTMAGWVHKDAFGGAGGKLAANNPAAACAGGQIHIQTDHDFCALPCRTDDDCAAVRGVCDGSGRIESSTAAFGLDGRYCATAGH
jgi:hypothetical protein